MTRVYKLGGPALEDAALVPALVADLKRAPGRCLVVHGGGRHVERRLRERQIPADFVNGRRATSPAAMEVVEMVLSGSVNKGLVAALNAAGLPALGLSGRDGGLLVARRLPELGQVGQPARVDPATLHAAWAQGFTPVVSPVSSGLAGEALNVNADEAALALALAVNASSLVYLSDVDGVKVGGRVVEGLDAAVAERAIAEGVITGGMALKVSVALEAVRAGIAEVVIAGPARLQGGFPGTTLRSGAAKPELEMGGVRASA